MGRFGLAAVAVLIALAPLSAIAQTPASQPRTQSANLYAPFDPDPQHLWNRLARTLLVRSGPDGARYVDELFPLLTPNVKYLLHGAAHREAIAVLDEFLAHEGQKLESDPKKQAMLQRDLWSVFDWCAWVPDDWVYPRADEPAAMALRQRLAKIIALLELSPREIAGLGDNYQDAVGAHRYPTQYDPARPDAPFLPGDFYDEKGPWVRLAGDVAISPDHRQSAGGRSLFLVFLRLPGGRAATLSYLRGLGPRKAQFPAGTAVAMVRRALVIDEHNRLAMTELTESVQIRVYAEIPRWDPAEGPFRPFPRGRQDVCEFQLDRPQFFAAHAGGLRAVRPDDKPVTFSFDRTGGLTDDDFSAPDRFRKFVQPSPTNTTLQTCVMCHQGPGVYSVFNISRALGNDDKPWTSPFLADVPAARMEIQVRSAMAYKSRLFNWGLLQGMLDANAAQGH